MCCRLFLVSSKLVPATAKACLLVARANGDLDSTSSIVSFLAAHQKDSKKPQTDIGAQRKPRPNIIASPQRSEQAIEVELLCSLSKMMRLCISRSFNWVANWRQSLRLKIVSGASPSLSLSQYIAAIGYRHRRTDTDHAYFDYST